MQYSILLSALCATSALAIQVTQPSKDTDWSDNDSNVIKWTSVSTDPSTVNIVLVNQHVNPPISTTIASNIQTSDGSYTVSSLSGHGSNFQINLVSATAGNSAILAQSEQFSLKEGGGSSSSVVSSAGGATTVTVSTTTVSGSVVSTPTTVTGSTGLVTVTTVTGTTKASATGSMTGSATGTMSGTASGSAATATPTSGAETKIASLAGVAMAGLFALFA
ncbi:Ferredoxin-fold anticodon-binding domain-containing protein 1 [Trapelia coarctata]|nr:Ferredoxin-fold anticodon-binding domain-containing protein 1 [Trapelia coarctata]